MIAYARLYAAELEELLGGSERALDAISVDYAAGRERTPHDGPNEASFDVFGGLSVSAWDDAALQAIAGMTLDTRGGPMAGRLAKAARLTPWLVLTEQRLLVVDDLGDPERQAVTWSVPLEHVSVVRHDPKLPVELGRLLVAFDDSSLVRLRAGLLLPFAARRFSRAFRELRGDGEPRRSRG